MLVIVRRVPTGDAERKEKKKEKKKKGEKKNFPQFPSTLNS